MVKRIIALTFIAAILNLQSCTPSKTEEVCIDNHVPDRTAPENIDGDSIRPWVNDDYVPLRFLKIRHLDVNQISTIYGPPIGTVPDTVRADHKYAYGGDDASLYKSFYNSPDTILQLFVWEIDSTTCLTLYCTKGSNEVYRPIWGYKYNWRKVMLE